MSANVPANRGVFELKTWAQTRVKAEVCPLLPRKEKDWPAFEVALKCAVIQNPDLRKGIAAAPESALLSVIKCARAGLSLDPVMEHFALIPYAGKNPTVEGQIMVRGWIHMMQSPAVAWMDGDVVFKQEYDRTMPFRNANGSINHAPHIFERDNYPDSDILGAYAYAKLATSDRYVAAFLGIKEIEKRRKMGFGDTPAWKHHYRRMCVVKALKALGRSGLIPLKPAILAELRADEPDEPAQPAPVGVPLGELPRPMLPQVDDLPAEWDEGQKSTFRELDKDPLPDDEHARDIAIGALANLVAQLKMKPAQVKLVSMHLFKADVEMAKLTKEQAELMADYLRKEEK